MKIYADFEISLRSGNETSYLVDYRFDDPDSEAVEGLEGEPAYAKLDLDSFKINSYDIPAYSQALTDALFADSRIGDAFGKACVRVSSSEDKKLRFRLSISSNAREIYNLRWETLLDPRDRTPLCTNENILFSRYLTSYDWRPVKLRPRANLSALVVVANPSDLADYHLAPIKVEEELERARQALGEISTTTLPDPRENLHVTMENILAQLREHEYDILYLVAHGALKNNNWPRLWLEGDDGKTKNTSGQELAIRIKELEKRPRLMILASCESAGNDEGDALSALGPRLAEAGIPAVLAMQGKITMATNAKFMAEFFKQLMRDGQIDRAMAVARGTVRDRDDFWMPVLFMRLKNGRIWYELGFGEKFDKWPALLEYIRSHEYTPILGPGLFEPYFGSLSDIAQSWADEYGYPMSQSDRDSLPRVAQYLTIDQSPQFPLQRYQRFLRKEIIKRYQNDLSEELLDPFEEKTVDDMIDEIGVKRRQRYPDDSYKLLAQLPSRIYITTNLNSMLSDALREQGRDPVVVLAPWNNYTVKRIKQLDKSYDPNPKRPLVYHLFGRLSEKESVVLTEDDYFDYLLGISSNNSIIPKYVRSALSVTSLLFIGFSMDEWNFRVLFRSIIDKTSEMSKSYIHIAAQIEPEEGRIIDPDGARKYLEEYFKQSASITIYWGSSEEFLRELMQRWNADARAGAR